MQAWLVLSLLTIPFASQTILLKSFSSFWRTCFTTSFNEGLLVDSLHSGKCFDIVSERVFWECNYRIIVIISQYFKGITQCSSQFCCWEVYCYSNYCSFFSDLPFFSGYFYNFLRVFSIKQFCLEIEVYVPCHILCSDTLETVC